MATAKQTDRYSNILTQSITMSGANTLTFQEVNIGISLFEKAGILISRIEYQPTMATVDLMTASSDDIIMAVTTSNQLTSLTPEQQSVIHQMDFARFDFGTAASGQFFSVPWQYDFGQLPGGGLLITPRPWYVAMQSVGLASAGSGYVRFYFTVVQLKPEEYFELLETRTFFG